jgi:hypothetical protein
MVTILQMLQSIRFPLEIRRSVRKSIDDKKKGFVLGRVVQYGVGYRLSNMAKKHKVLTQRLNAWMAQKNPDFRYTTIQVNCGGSGLHIDRLNCGLSVIKAFGNFSGGELWTLAKPKKLFNVKKGHVYIDGNIPHITMPFEGERYSIVFFATRGRYKDMPPADQVLYKKLGFPRAPQSKTCTDAQKDRLSEAADILKGHYGLADDDIGDFLNTSFPVRHQRSSKKPDSP